MTKFDLAVLAIFALSALVGLARGATRELTTMFAFVAAAVLALLALRFTGPIARHVIHASWLASTVAVTSAFLLLYIGFRLVGGVLTRGVRSTVLSGPEPARRRCGWRGAGLGGGRGVGPCCSMR